MARSFSNAKFIATFVADRLAAISSRRGYAAASQGVESSSVRGGGGGRNNVMFKKTGEEFKETATSASWVPDPVTGYYRPEKANEIDPAELRQMLLKHTK